MASSGLSEIPESTFGGISTILISGEKYAFPSFTGSQFRINASFVCQDGD